jgi:hypothetical protein
MEKAGRLVPSTSNDATCAAVRSATTRPARSEYPGSNITPVADARVPALAPLRMSPRTK